MKKDSVAKANTVMEDFADNRAHSRIFRWAGGIYVWSGYNTF